MGVVDVLEYVTAELRIGERLIRQIDDVTRNIPDRLDLQPAAYMPRQPVDHPAVEVRQHADLLEHRKKRAGGQQLGILLLETDEDFVECAVVALPKERDDGL